MAKILLVSKKVTRTAWQLAEALKSQQHEVIFITSHGESVPYSNDIDFMAYFKNWSALEIARLLPNLISKSPQIVHFVLESEKITAAHLGLWSFAKVQNSVVFTLSLLHLEKGLNDRNWVRYLVQQSDIVTCPSIDSLALLRGVNIKSKRQGRAVLPPVLSFHEESILTTDEDLEFEDLLQGHPYLVRPFLQNNFDPHAPFFQELLKTLKLCKVVLLGSQDNWNLRERKQFQTWLQNEGLENQWFLTGHQSAHESRHLIKNSEALWLSDLDLSPIELTEYFLAAIDTHSTLILDHHQELLHAPLWRNSENCWIFESFELSQKLSLNLSQKSLGLKLTYELDRHSVERKDLVDAPLNELNRLYNRALSHVKN